MQDQASANFTAFRELLPSLLAQFRGQHVLIHDGQIVGFFPSSLSAITKGYSDFGEGQFSVELVDDAPEDLGFFSHVSAALRA